MITKKLVAIYLVSLEMFLEI